jgi:hypothetical protein
VCRQEAEDTVRALVRALVDGTPVDDVPGLALLRGTDVVLTAHPELPDLATLPVPDRRGEPAACFGHGIAPLVSSRGCYANCSFRYRLRDVNAVADEMVAMKRDRGVDIFVFHDDNFFVPGHRHNKERFSALADALEARGIGRYATVVKARPTDVDPEVFRILRDRLHCIRVYIGIETDADQGLRTLRRWSKSRQNHTAIDLVRELDLYTCFNMLVFDPDTTVESLETNIEFLRYAPEFPSNFGRVELYAGTPLLARMKTEKRCRGDYMQWDYSLATPEIERVFALSMEAFHERNFGEGALANRIMGTRFDVEVVRHFHPEAFRAEWLARGKELSRRLTLTGADGLSEIVSFVKRGGGLAEERTLVESLASRMREVEAEIGEGARELARELLASVGQGAPLTEIGDRVMTPLQRARETEPFVNQGAAE